MDGSGENPAPDALPELSREELDRYARHLILPEVGAAGQRALKRSKVLCVGAGGLGSPLALYLAAAGVGTLGLVDFDDVDVSNLQRQVLYGTEDVGRPKLEAAARRLRSLNPNVAVVTHAERLTADNALDVVSRYDVVADGTDNFPTRYLVNDACVLLGKPNVHASIFRFEGQASVFWAAKGPCYRCVFPEPPPPGLVPSCAEGGVLGVLPGLLGVLQATETVKLLLGIGEPLVGRLLLVDTLAMAFRTLTLKKDPNCAVCGPRPTITRLVDEEALACAAGVEPELPTLSVEELRAWQDAGRPFVLLDVREPHETALSSIPNSLKIPLGALARSVGRLSPSDDVVVHCKSGARSARAARLLRDAGFPNVRNLAGGIDRWRAVFG